jgi:phosphoribosyl-ATP pyrophosphohydrolase/phosphoribosyl-AMP cyclohydrolase
MTMINIEEIKFDERGLVPAIAQNARTGEVLTLAYMNAESLARTLRDREMWYWSRSRQELWHKGETSGNTQRVLEMRIDCDKDALIFMVEPAGPACHTGAQSCFHNSLTSAPALDKSFNAREGSSDEAPDLGLILKKLYSVIESRKREQPAGSYTTYLFEKGLDKILKKIGEESTETIVAAKNNDASALIAETSDLLYHLMVLLVERDVKLESVRDELSRRSEKQNG